MKVLLLTLIEFSYIGRFYFTLHNGLPGKYATDVLSNHQQDTVLHNFTQSILNATSVPYITSSVTVNPTVSNKIFAKMANAIQISWNDFSDGRKPGEVKRTDTKVEKVDGKSHVISLPIPIPIVHPVAAGGIPPPMPTFPAHPFAGGGMVPMPMPASMPLMMPLLSENPFVDTGIVPMRSANPFARGNEILMPTLHSPLRPFARGGMPMPMYAQMPPSSAASGPVIVPESRSYYKPVVHNQYIHCDSCFTQKVRRIVREEIEKERRHHQLYPINENIFDTNTDVETRDIRDVEKYDRDSSADTDHVLEYYDGAVHVNI